MLIKNATIAILILLASCEVQESKNIYTSPDIPEALNINFDSNSILRKSYIKLLSYYQKFLTMMLILIIK
jgi:hypothetical protein